MYINKLIKLSVLPKSHLFSYALSRSTYIYIHTSSPKTFLEYKSLAATSMHFRLAALQLSCIKVYIYLHAFSIFNLFLKFKTTNKEIRLYILIWYMVSRPPILTLPI